MEHAEDDPAQLHDLLQLTFVLVTFKSFFIFGTDVLKYMQDTAQSGGGPVKCVFKRDHFTHVVDFRKHADAVNVVRRARHTIKGRPACVFLYDANTRSVYSGHQTLSCQDKLGKFALDIPAVDPRNPTTVLLTNVPWKATTETIRVSMQRMHIVKSVQRLKPVDIAIVEFQHSEGARSVVNMTTVKVNTIFWKRTVNLFVLRPLPSDPADIPNTAHTAIVDMPATAHDMEHAVNDQAQLYAVSQLKSVIVASWRYFGRRIGKTAVRKYMGTMGKVDCVTRLHGNTYVVDFREHADAVNVVRRDHHSIKGRPVCVFLYDREENTAYSGHQTVSCQGKPGKLVVDIQRVDPRNPTTVLLTNVPWKATTETIRVSMQKMRDVNSVQRLKPVHIAIVEFQHSEGARSVVNMNTVKVNTTFGWQRSVNVFVLRPLPSGPADTPNTSQTTIANMPVAASAARVGQTQALERMQRSEQTEVKHRLTMARLSYQSGGQGVTEVRGPGLEVTNPSFAGSDED